MTDVIDDLPVADLAFHVEQHGIDYIPDVGALGDAARDRGPVGRRERQRRVPRLRRDPDDLRVQLRRGRRDHRRGEPVVGARRARVAAGPAGRHDGVRRSTGPRSARGARKAVALCNWLTMLGFEAEGLILIVGAGLVLSAPRPGSTRHGPLKVALIIAAVGVQVVLPVPRPRDDGARPAVAHRAVRR